jgi:hypothetical protein
LRARIRRLEEDNVRKRKEIDDFYDTNKVVSLIDEYIITFSFKGWRYKTIIDWSIHSDERKLNVKNKINLCFCDL